MTVNELAAGCRSGAALLAACWLLLAGAASGQSPVAADAFVIEVVDAETKRPVPLVELETLAHHRFVTDSAGRAAVTELDLLGRKVFFYVHSHGYQFAKDGFGFEGTALEVVGGRKATLAIKRHNLAERLYRTTGSGIYVDSVRAGLMDRHEPLLNGDVVGCDSVMTALYQNKLYWFWGDTNRPHYPIGGNFHITGATTVAPSRTAVGGNASGKREPNSLPQQPRPAAVDKTFEARPPKFDYFVDDQRAVRSVAKMAGDGPTWISAVTVLPGENQGRPRMLANYVKVRGQLDAYRWGFVAWDDDQQKFVELSSTDKQPPMFPPSQVHTFLHTDQGEEYVYFCHPLPLTRVRATQQAFVDPSQYEGYTCLVDGTTLADRKLDRDGSGQLKFAWKRNTLPLTQQDQNKLIEAGLMNADESRIVLKDQQSNRRIVAHSGSVAWNEYRQKWILIAVEIGGASSLLGDVWFAEAASPEGPWLSAYKILSHDNYSFYNPKHHPYFDAEDGRLVYFEGTYTTSFSGNKHPTPRYDYNQIMYRLDLARPELAPFLKNRE